jgi:hypothetical protein
MLAHTAVYFRHCLEDLTGQAAALQRHVERLESVTLDAISLEVRICRCFYLQLHINATHDAHSIATPQPC